LGSIFPFVSIDAERRARQGFSQCQKTRGKEEEQRKKKKEEEGRIKENSLGFLPQNVAGIEQGLEIGFERKVGLVGQFGQVVETFG